MKKKQISAVAAIVMCLAILASGTIAYFTAEDEVHNVITSGGVDIAIEEWQQEGDKLVPYEDPDGVMPGSTVSKIVTVKNLDADCYIRARIEVEVFKDGKEMELTPAQMAAAIQITVKEVAPGSEQVGWMKNTPDDGWYYYSEIVAENTATEALISEVIFSGPNMGNEFQNCTITVTVYAQAVQAANNGASALEALGWPAE